MSNPDASDLARNAANARWRGRVVSRSLPVVIERIGELADGEVARLAHAAAEETARRAAVATAEERA
jgi:hypothetical protein